MKKIAWIDTIRIMAALMVIFAHYFMCAGFKDSSPYLHHALSYDVAIIGVAIFLAMSGYLIPASLKRAPSLGKFYVRKFIRIVAPFTMSYLALTAALAPVALFSEEIFNLLPIFNLLRGGDFSAIILGMFPVDFNAAVFFGVTVYIFVGEWFMATILWLYLLAPLLNYFAVRRPLISLAASIVVSCAAFYATQGVIFDPWALFVVRVPEFLFGMILFLHRERLKKFQPQLVIGSSIFLAANLIYFVATFKLETGMFFSASPASFALTLPAIYLLFTFAEMLDKFRLKIFERLNSLCADSYVAMIIQHVIIQLFALAIAFETLDEFGRFVVLLLIIVTTFAAARIINKFSFK